MDGIWEKFLSVEGEIHSDRSHSEIEAFFGGFQVQGFYEDGMFNRNYRDFENDELFNFAYNKAVQDATSTGIDAHIRWRARIFDYLLRIRLPGKCVELGTAHGFMFYFALVKMRASGYDFGKSEIVLIDKFDTESIDPVTGTPSGISNWGYSSGISFLHINLNAAKPEVDALRFLFPNLLKGCVIVLDDYGFLEYSESQRAHEGLAHDLGYEILSLPTGQGIILL